MDPVEALQYLPEPQRSELTNLLRDDSLAWPWRPLPGPQETAFQCTADIVGFGGAAGGGKSMLAIGKALWQHQRVAFFRQNSTELTAVVDEIANLLGSRDGYSAHTSLWRCTGFAGQPVQIEFGSFPNAGDEEKYRGRPHDLIVFDEAASMRYRAVRFLLGWLRTVDPLQRCQALLTFNPPTSAEGRWIIDFFAPWLDPKHPNPAKPGELRWFATKDGKEQEVPSPEAFRDHTGRLIRPMSRTFIPSRVADNPYLVGTGYESMLASMPEPWRSQMLEGDFRAGMQDDPLQVIPTIWVEAAMSRWKPIDGAKPPMDAMGVDVAMGGSDRTVIARRHGRWFDELIVHPGAVCRDGPTIAGLVIAALRDGAPIALDLFGVGAHPYAHLMTLGTQVTGVEMGQKASGHDRSGRLSFFDERSKLWWRVREALDPGLGLGYALPPDRELLQELTAPLFEESGRTIKVQKRDKIVEKIGRSPDKATAVMLAMMDMPQIEARRVPTAEEQHLANKIGVTIRIDDEEPDRFGYRSRFV